MRGDDSVFWALLLLLVGGSSVSPLPGPSTPSGGGGGALPPSPPAPQPGPALPQPPPADIDVGWWWYWFPTEQAPLFQAALDKELRRAKRRKRGRRWEVRKTMGGTSLGATVVVFYCWEPFHWELPGLPEPAPKGLDTAYADVAWAIPEPPSALRRMIEQLAQKTWEVLRESVRTERWFPKKQAPPPSR